MERGKGRGMKGINLTKVQCMLGEIAPWNSFVQLLYINKKKKKKKRKSLLGPE
jgi:hypothetical protein